MRMYVLREWRRLVMVKRRRSWRTISQQETISKSILSVTHKMDTGWLVLCRGSHGGSGDIPQKPRGGHLVVIWWYIHTR